jgi:PST family polysaccharide transporter
MISSFITKYKDKPLVSNVFYLSLLLGFNYLLPLILFPFLFRVLGVEKYGLIAFSYSLTIFLTIFTDFGYNLFATRCIAIHRDNKEKINQIFSETIISKFLLLIISFIIVYILCYTLTQFRTHKTVFFLMFGVVIGNCMFPMWFFQGMEKMKFVTITNVIAKSLSFIPMFIFVRNENDLLWVPLFYSLGYISAGIISWIILFRQFHIQFICPEMIHVLQSLKNSSQFFLSRASVSIFTTCNTLVLGIVCGNVMVGYYNIAEKINDAFNSLIGPVSQTLYPHISKTKNIKLFVKIFSFCSIANLFFVALVFIFSKPLLLFIFNTDNTYSLTILWIFLIDCAFTVPSQLLGYPFLAALGHVKFTNYTVVLVACIHIVIITLLYFLNWISVYSIASMYVISELLIFIFRIWGVQKYIYKWNLS